MLDQLTEIQQAALADLQTVQDAEALERWRVARLGRSSALMQVFDGMGKLPKEERPAIGRRANEVKRLLETALASARCFASSSARVRSGSPGCPPKPRRRMAPPRKPSPIFSRSFMTTMYG